MVENQRNQNAGNTDVLNDDERPRTNKMRDEMSPEKGQPAEQRKTGGEQRDTAGQHGRMAPETAKALDEQQNE